MPSPCPRCAATCTLNLDTAQRIGTAGSALIGGAFGAWQATHGATTLPSSLSKIPAAISGAAVGGIAGSRMALQCFAHWLPPGQGVPWLCRSCGHVYRHAPSSASLSH